MAGKTRTSYLSDDLLRSAVERKLSIVGETEQAIGMRNRLVHGYWAVDHDIVLAVIDSGISALRRQVRELLGDDDPAAGSSSDTEGLAGV